MPLLSIKNLSIEFPGRHETDYAVEDVSFDLEPCEILGLVGESGAGKSTIGIVQLPSPPGRVSKGDIYLNDTRISTFTDKEIPKRRAARSICSTLSASRIPKSASNSSRASLPAACASVS